MLSFKEYLEERKANPLALANRVARRFGKKTKYGDWEKVEKGKHIPLSGYNARQATGALDRSWEVRSKIGGKDYFNSENKPKQDQAIARYNNAHETTTVNIKDLHPTQPYVRTQDQQILGKKLQQTSPEHITVVTHKKKKFIMDGHHAVMAAALRGEKTVKVKHLDMDKY